MHSWQKDVWHFHKASGLPAPDKLTMPPAKDLERRQKLIAEEATETCDALNKLICLEQEAERVAGDPDENSRLAVKRADLVREIVDGLVDTVVVVLGTAVELGVDLDPAWAEVHASNMDKYPYHKNEWGKVIKPALWRAPRIPLVDQVRDET